MRDVAEILWQTFRESGVMARIGGDEFAVMAMENSNSGQDTVRLRLQEGTSV
ncbi:MAG: diguanylate cyclase domain-containing protein [Thermoleophilia bacterium]